MGCYWHIYLIKHIIISNFFQLSLASNILYSRQKYIISILMIVLDVLIRISVSYLWFFSCIMLCLRYYINFDTFVYLFIQFWYIRLSVLCLCYFSCCVVFFLSCFNYFSCVISNIIKSNIDHNWCVFTAMPS